MIVFRKVGDRPMASLNLGVVPGPGGELSLTMEAGESFVINTPLGPLNVERTQDMFSIVCWDGVVCFNAETSENEHGLCLELLVRQCACTVSVMAGNCSQHGTDCKCTPGVVDTQGQLWAECPGPYHGSSFCLEERFQRVCCDQGHEFVFKIQDGPNDQAGHVWVDNPRCRECCPNHKGGVRR